MKTEIFVVCDFAVDYAGKLTLAGIFDTLGAPATPVIHPRLCIAAKLRFEDTEAGAKRVCLTMTDADGRSVLPAIDFPIAVPHASGENATSVVNLVFNLGGVKFERLGEHAADLSLDGIPVASTPIFIRPATAEAN